MVRAGLGAPMGGADGLQGRAGNLHWFSFQGLCFGSLLCFYESVIRAECTFNIASLRVSCTRADPLIAISAGQSIRRDWN